LWLWLLRGSPESAPLAVHRFLIQPIAKSRPALIAGTLLALTVAALGMTGIVAARGGVDRPPTAGAGKLLVVVFSPHSSGPAGPRHFAEDVVSGVRDVDEHVEFATPAVPFSDRLVAAWKEDGVSPFLIVASDYDGFQLRVSFKISQSELSVKMNSGDSQSIGRSPLSFLPIRLDRIDPQRLALSPSTDANLLIDEYPQQVDSTIRLILGIQALAESRLPAALGWLEPRVYRWDRDRPHDESLRAALRAVALQRTYNSNALTEIGQSVTSFSRRLDRTDDVVVTGDLAKRLPRLLAVAHNYVTAPRLVAALQRADGLEMQSAKQLPEIFKQAYGEQWVPLMRFGEAYQFYAYDESFRALPADERAELTTEIAASLEGMPRQKAAIEPLCDSVLLPDGSTYRPINGIGLLARNWAECPDCEKPRVLLEAFSRAYMLCDARNR